MSPGTYADVVEPGTLAPYLRGSRTTTPENFRCETCMTVFHVFNDQIKCNGQVITKCPWCRPDSAPWTNGRGV